MYIYIYICTCICLYWKLFVVDFSNKLIPIFYGCTFMLIIIFIIMNWCALYYLIKVELCTEHF